MSKTTNKFAPKVRERAVRMVVDRERDYVTLEWVDWFNHRRLLEPIGNISPAEAQEQYYVAVNDIDMA